MTPSWESVTAFATVLASALGFGVAHGKLRQKVNDMNKQVVGNSGRITKIEEKAGDTEGDRREIMAKLDNLAEGQKDMRDLLIRHIEKREP